MCSRAELESSWLPVSRSGLFFLTSPAEWEVEWGVPFILFGGRPAQSSDFSLLWLDGCLICRHRSSVLVLLPCTVSFSPLCGLRLLPASHPPWPPRGLPQNRSVKIVSFSDPIPFLVSPTCVQLWVPVLWQVFFSLSCLYHMCIYLYICMKLYESGLQVGTIAESKGFHTHNIPNLMFQL